MPEGDTIFLLAKRLGARVEGAMVTSFDAWDPAIRGVELVGQQLRGIEARGKNLLFLFADDLALHSHLKMDGKWVYRATTPLPQPGGRLEAVIGFEGGALLGYELGLLRWVHLNRLPAHDPLRTLGPDLLGAAVDEREVARQLVASGSLPVGIAVMRQRIMAGVGNEYKSELLFLEHLHPLTPCGDLSEQEAYGLVSRARKLLRRNVAGAQWGPKPRQTRDRVGGGSAVWVYGRGGQRCLVCDDRISRIYQGDPPRSTYFCPTCQRSREAVHALRPSRAGRWDGGLRRGQSQAPQLPETQGETVEQGDGGEKQGGFQPRQHADADE